MNDRKKIISLDISTISYSKALEEGLLLAQNKVPSYYCFSNVHMVMEAFKDAELAGMINRSTRSFPDGMPLVYALRKLYGIQQDRIAGIDYMLDFCRVCAENGVGIYLLGSTDSILNQLTINLNKRFPGIRIAGQYSPPFKMLSEIEEEAICQKINHSGAGAIFVSLGCPKQEKWMARNYKRIQGLQMGVGAAFEIHADKRMRAPRWMQRAGLEWLFRLWQDPIRLGKRYFQTNVAFSIMLLREIIKAPKSKQ